MNNPFNTSNTKQIKCVCICCCFAYSSQSVVDTYASAPHRHIEITQYSIGVRFFYRIFFVSAYTANRCQKFRFVYETYCYIYKMQNRFASCSVDLTVDATVVDSVASCSVDLTRWMANLVWFLLCQREYRYFFFSVQMDTNAFSQIEWVNELWTITDQQIHLVYG